MGSACADPEGRDRGLDPPPLINHKHIGFLSNTCPEALKNQASISMEFRWRANDGLLLVVPLISTKKHLC